MKIIVSTALLAPYRVDWLDELGKHAEVSVFYLYDNDKDRTKEWLSKRPANCTYHLMSGRYFPVLGKVSSDFRREIENCHYDCIILDGYGYFDQLLNIQYLYRKGIAFYLNIDGIVKKENEYKLVKGLKKRILKKVPFFLCGSKLANDILADYGVNKECIFNHPFTSLFERDIYTSVATSNEKVLLRKLLGIIEEKVIISVGRFTYKGGYGKGYDVLISAAKLLGEEYGWYIVGGLPTAEFIQMTGAAQLKNVHFIDHVTKEKLKEYYRASDIFVLMSISDVWGLVVNEAMACGLPIITSDKCMAGFDLIKSGENGFIVPVGSVVELVKSIKMIYDLNINGQMGRQSINIIKNYTIEKLAQTHLNIFNTCK